MVLKNFLWDYSGRLMTMVVSLVITGILSRILDPADYGLMGLVMAISGIASMFLDFGFSSAIVQKVDIQDEQLSTIFFLNFGVGIFIYVSLYLLSPYIADYYDSITLAAILKVSALAFIFTPINLVPTALIQKHMLFKQQAVRNLITTFLIGLLAIWLAYHGWGIWSLVMQSLTGIIISLIINLGISKWKPKMHFSLSGISSMFRYSIFLFFSSILNNIFTKIDVFLIGKAFSLPILGQYSRAQGFDGMVRGVSTSSLISVLFPYFSKIQQDDELVKKQWEKFFNFICLGCFLFMGWAFLSAKFIFNIMFGDKWFVSADYFKIIALTGFVYPLSSLALGIMEARGHSQDFFIVEVCKKIIVLPCFFIAYYLGIKWFLISLLFSYTIALILNLVFLKRTIHYNIGNFIIELAKYIFAFIVFLLFSYLFDYELLTNSVNIWVVIAINMIFTIYYLLAVYFFQPSTVVMAYQSVLLILNKNDTRK